MACNNCRVKKVKCSYTVPSSYGSLTTCDYCKARSLSCTSTPGKRQRTMTIETPQKRMRFGWARIYPDRDAPQSNTPQAYPEKAFDENSTTFLQFRRLSESPSTRSDSPILPNRRYHEAFPDSSSSNLSSASPLMVTRTQSISDDTKSDDTKKILIDTILWSPELYSSQEDNSILARQDNERFEFTGPSSGISLLSDNGLRWVLKKTGDQESIATLREFAEDIVSHFAIPVNEEESIKILTAFQELVNPLPEPVLAAEYVNAYFDTDQQGFPLLDRKCFERQLQSHSGQASLKDIPWYALYNSVLAVGCRIAGSKQTSSDRPEAFSEVEIEAEKYFLNAVYVQSELICRRANITTVQAFAVMTLYTQQSSTPQCEYKFCSMAVRLAQGMGMHKKASSNWGLTLAEAEERSRVFWVLYWMDKTISLRMGRPSAIDDAEVSCPFPATISAGRTTNRTTDINSSFNFLLYAARYARICSQIITLMYSATALISPLSQLFQTAESLEEKIEKWHSDIPTYARQGHSGRKDIPRIPKMHTLALEFFYHYAICAIHRRFPPQTFWQQSPCSFDQKTIDKMVDKARKCLEASRSICLLSSKLEVQAYSPSWLLIYYPLSGIITLFTNVVADPLASTSNTDVALMEVVTGVFGKLEFCTSGSMAFTKTAELSRLARKAIKKARRERAQQASITNSGVNITPGTVANFCDTVRSLGEAVPAIPDTSWLDCHDLERWNIDLDFEMELVHDLQADGTFWPGT